MIKYEDLFFETVYVWICDKNMPWFWISGAMWPLLWVLMSNFGLMKRFKLSNTFPSRRYFMWEKIFTIYCCIVFSFIFSTVLGWSSIFKKIFITDSALITCGVEADFLIIWQSRKERCRERTWKWVEISQCPF